MPDLFGPPRPICSRSDQQFDVANIYFAYFINPETSCAAVALRVIYSRGCAGQGEQAAAAAESGICL